MFLDLKRLEAKTRYRIDIKAPGRKSITEGSHVLDVQRTDTTRTTNTSTSVITITRIVTVCSNQ
ncbi:MAG: hypothetical protein SVU32_05145 [Candidatus Nanohaloarchaea archaeon]|nr:hypothetical protein [Candidatus Nanohaloarchaea archaeon]